MSMTLNLVDRLLAMGRTFQHLGRTHDARTALGKLAAFGDLPAATAEETQVRLAELHLSQRKYRRARRHLTAALLHQPTNARYHYLLATALDNDGQGDDNRAAEHYRKSLELDPEQPRCLGAYGLLLLRQGQTEDGLKALRRAGELAPDNPEAVGTLVEGLRREGLLDEARLALRAALFRNSRDARFHRLRSDFEYHQLRQQQEAGRRRNRAGQGEDGPVLLPFVRPEAPSKPVHVVRKIVRRDDASPPPAPHLARRARRPDQKRAQ
jgi:Tfp pilus assembly protein PilF